MQKSYELEKARLIEHLRTSGKFNDFIYSGSNLNVLLDTLSVNTSNITNIISMLVNESTPQTAKLKESLIVHALKSGFVVRRVGAATAVVRLTVDVGNAIVTSDVMVYKGTTFTGTNVDGAQIQFVATQDTKLNKTGLTTYTGSVTISQGVYTDNNIVYNSDQSTIVKFVSTFCDIDTISISVTEPSGFTTPYKVYDGRYSPLGNEPIAYVTLGVDMYYSIAFGKNKFGLQPTNNATIRYSYLRTSGELGNNVGQFLYQANGNVNGLSNNDARRYAISVETQANSVGGFSEIDIDVLKGMLTYYNRSAGIALTPTDIKNKIMYIYQNIESIYVEGGQRDILYGKVIVSIKPKNSDTLSVGDKIFIKEELEKKYLLNADTIVFVDPDFIELSLSIEYTPAQTNTLYTKDNNTTFIKNMTAQFSDELLGKFESSYSDISLINYLNKDVVQYSDVYINKLLKYNLATSSNKLSYDFTVNVRVSDFNTDKFTVGEVAGYEYRSKDGAISLYNGNKQIVESVGTIDYITGTVKIDNSALNLGDNIITFNFNTARNVITSDKHIIRISSVEVI